MQKEDIVTLLLRKGSENVFSFYVLFVIFVLFSLYMIFFFARFIIHAKRKKKDKVILHNESSYDEHRWENEGGPIHTDEDS